ncbi:Hsp20/alpha crystallin family protein [Rhodoferax sp.]|uniref:Hsp20/alpha crystallin family protein n=1 Tax=Rhodoferax sp. TaxID=50421 RepID=UPI0039B83851
MLSEAPDLPQTTHRLAHQYFQIGQTRELLCWEPPVDMHQRQDELGVLVALPGVAPDRYQVSLAHSVLIVRAERARSVSFSSGLILHLEIPYGRFERRIRLPAGEYHLVSMRLEHGCLRLQLARQI